MSWGRGIAIALASFIVFIATLVTIIIRQKVDLVSEDYYQNEIAFQEEIESRSKGNVLGRFTTRETAEFLVFEFPNQKDMDSIKVNLLRPNDKAMDQSYKVEKNAPLIIPQEVLVRGNYQVECFYFQSGKRLSQYGELKIN